MIRSKLCIEGTPGWRGKGSAEQFPHSLFWPLWADRTWMCTFSWLCPGSCVRTWLWRFLVGSVCSHLWHWAFGEGEKTVAEAEQLIDHDLLVYAFYSTLKQEFDVSVRGNSGLLVWVFRDFYNSYLYAYFKWGEWQGNASDNWNIPLKLCIPLNRDCTYIQSKNPKQHQLFFFPL